jgi:hypothetical protein
MDIEYELYNIKINSDNILNNSLIQTDCKSILNISSKIEYIPIIISRYVNIFCKWKCSLNCNDLSYEFMKKTFWLEYLSNQTLEKETNKARKLILQWFKNKIINQDYYLSIVYYSSKHLVIGIFIMNIDMLDINLDSFKIETVILLSKVVINEKNDFKFNIFLGILHYYNNLKKELENQFKMQSIIETHLDKKLNKQYIISWKMLLMNCCNYLPKLELVIKEKQVIGFFQNRLNP